MLDNLDKKILNLLQDKGKTSLSSIAEVVGLSIPSVSDRLHKLEERGIIEGYYAKVNRKAFGLDIMAFITVISESSTYYAEMLERVSEISEILECHSILGEGSHMLKAVVKNSEALERLLSNIQAWPGVLSTRTSFVLSTNKETTKIPIHEE